MKKTAAEISALPLRSPLGPWGSVAGFVLASVATIQTWLPRANFYSGTACVGLLTLAYFLIKRFRPANAGN